MGEAESGADRWRTALAPLLADPARGAVLSDLDGTLAPIVLDPAAVRVPERTRRALKRIATRFALCTIVTGRPPLAAREILGIDEIAYAGNHGFELLVPGAELAIPSPALDGHAGDVASFASSRIDAEALASLGVMVEDKGPIFALHWRGAPDAEYAEARIRDVAADAEAAGLFTHLGRLVIELRPPVAIDKGVAVSGLLAAASVGAAVFAGDDRTDVDGFRALERARQAGELDDILRIGVLSAEGPEEIRAESDLTVESTEELADLLEVLAG